MKRLLFQCRAVTDPIKNPLIGWWYEFYCFYVKHRDLDGRDDFTQMVLQPGYDLSSYQEAADPEYYHYEGGINWAKLCLKRVVEEYFRDEGEAWDVAEVGNMPSASILQNSWLDSTVNDADWVTHDLDVDLDSDTNIMASEVERAMNQWWLMRQQGLTEQTYEEWIRSYGVQMPDEAEPHRPELVRYVRAWSYPANTVDPTDGSVASALSWALSERADKIRFFREPGFLFGCCVCRPKVYRASQSGSAVGMLDDAYAWLPAILRGEFDHGWKKFAGTTTNSPNPADGPLPGVSDDYHTDVRDLFLYGDQFLNFEQSGVTDENGVALPSATLQKRYPSATDADALFVSANTVRVDGVVSLDIATALRDVSPRLAP